MSSDDNNRLLWLDFGDSVEIVSISTENVLIESTIEKNDIVHCFQHKFIDC